MKNEQEPRVSVSVDREMRGQLERTRERIFREHGIRPSLSAVANMLIRRGLEDADAGPQGGR